MFFQVKISNFGSSHPSYECITALRCLEKRRSDPKTWKKLTALESHCDLRKVTPRYDLDRRTIAAFLHRFFKVEQEYSEEEILKICGVLQVTFFIDFIIYFTQFKASLIIFSHCAEL